MPNSYFNDKNIVSPYNGNGNTIIQSSLGINDDNIPTASNTTFVQDMDDGGYSRGIIGRANDKAYGNNVRSSPMNTLKGAYHAAGLFSRDEIDFFNKRYRFGLINPHDSIGTVREYLFFTKPDLNIYPRNDYTGIASTSLAEYLQSQPFWLDMERRYLDVLKCLQSSLVPADRQPDPFNHLLENMVQSNLEVPGLTSEMIETPNNMYGVGYTYRGSSEASNNNIDFSLEFKDTKYLHVYNFFKAYEEYETLKHHGVLVPYMDYVYDKILYDQYSIYKIFVDDDGESIIYCGKFFGVKSKSLPRDAFSNTSFDNGLSYSIDFNAAFYDDGPEVMYQFNNLARSYYLSLPYQIDVHNHILDRVDNRPAQCAYIIGLPGDEKMYTMKEVTSTYAPGQRVLKLKWRGSDKY